MIVPQPKLLESFLIKSRNFCADEMFKSNFSSSGIGAVALRYSFAPSVTQDLCRLGKGRRRKQCCLLSGFPLFFEKSVSNYCFVSFEFAYSIDDFEISAGARDYLEFEKFVEFVLLVDLEIDFANVQVVDRRQGCFV